MDDLNKRLADCFSAVFADMPADQIPRASQASVGAWDSLAMVTLITVIEQEFAIQVAAEDIEGLISYDLVLDYLKDKLSAS